MLYVSSTESVGSVSTTHNTQNFNLFLDKLMAATKPLGQPRWHRVALSCVSTTPEYRRTLAARLRSSTLNIISPFFAVLSRDRCARDPRKAISTSPCAQCHCGPPICRCTMGTLVVCREEPCITRSGFPNFGASHGSHWEWPKLGRS